MSVKNSCHAVCFPVSVSRIGEASHPGPGSNLFTQETINVTTLNNPNSRDLLFQRKALDHLHPGTSHHHKTNCLSRKLIFPSTRFSFLPTHPDSAKPAAGVGLIAAQGVRCTNPTPQTEKLAFFTQQGRADIYNIDMGSSTALVVVNLYGWQGAANNTNSRKRTDELIEAAQQELDTTGIGPKVILGDFNTDIDSRKLITQRGWTDVSTNQQPVVPAHVRSAWSQESHENGLCSRQRFSFHSHHQL